MCGIVGGFISDCQLSSGVKALHHRGPDASGSFRDGPAAFGHTRLAIMDLERRSDQPFKHGHTTITFNGEIWNYRELRSELQNDGIIFRTTGDTEVLAAILDRWGSDGLQKLEGMFAVGWLRDDSDAVCIARDRFGEIPVHQTTAGRLAFASERKSLAVMGIPPLSIKDLTPGHWMASDGIETSGGRWYYPKSQPMNLDLLEAAGQLRQLLGDGCRERAMADVPVCCLLSGGVDSAAVALSLRPHVQELVCYTAVMDPTSRDLRCARETAFTLGLELVEVPIPVPSAEDLAEVIRIIEMPYKAQVEIGWPCLKLAQAMHADGFKVTFSGEGSDELWASYGFAYHGLKKQDWHSYRRDLFLDQSRKNFPRCNKIFMSQGIECRLPFLHTAVAEFALSLPRHAVQLPSRPKAVMQEAFRRLLPDSVIDRPKLAFQDGLGIKQRIANSIAHPKEYYLSEYRKEFEGHAGTN